MAKVSLEDQQAGVSECIRVAQVSGADPLAIEHATAALKTLMWVAEKIDLFREFHAIEQSEAVQEVKRAFPGARVSSVRRKR